MRGIAEAGTLNQKSFSGGRKLSQKSERLQSRTTGAMKDLLFAMSLVAACPKGPPIGDDSEARLTACLCSSWGCALQHLYYVAAPREELVCIPYVRGVPSNLWENKLHDPKVQIDFSSGQVRNPGITLAWFEFVVSASYSRTFFAVWLESGVEETSCPLQDAPLLGIQAWMSLWHLR